MDLIGICGMQVQYPRQKELIELYRSRGYFVVVGGSYASLCPKRYEGLADCVVSGEAEYMLPQFCRDFEAGEVKALYREEDTVALTDSPTPRFDLLKLHRYAQSTLQFSRGCPFRCEFCDIIVMFGRKPRTKTLEQVGAELDELRRQGVKNVFFVDDNLIGNLPLAKSLLRYLDEYQNKHQYFFSFSSEISLNVAQHPNLLALFHEAKFKWVFIGIESTDLDSLKETLKTQNLHEDILVSLRRIYSFGIEVMAGFTIGFDHDTPESFEYQYQFIMDSGVQRPMIGLLTAMPKTPLYERLRKDGRLNTLADVSDMTRPYTNVIPKGMSFDEMVTGYISLYRRLLGDREIAIRIKNKRRYIASPARRWGYGLRQSLVIMGRLIRKAIVPGGPRRWWYFFCSLPLSQPKALPMVIADWIAALTMRDFADRRLVYAETGTMGRSEGNTPPQESTVLRSLSSVPN